MTIIRYTSPLDQAFVSIRNASNLDIYSNEQLACIGEATRLVMQCAVDLPSCSNEKWVDVAVDQLGIRTAAMRSRISVKAMRARMLLTVGALLSDENLVDLTEANDFERPKLEDIRSI